MTFFRLALLALAALLHVAPVPASQPRSAAHPAAPHAQHHPASTADWKFMRRAAALGQGAITAGRLAASRAADPALRDVGGVLAGEHAALNQRLALLSLATQVPLPSRPPQEQRKALRALKQLKGPAFDSAFVTQVSAIEGQILRLFQAEALSRGGDPGVHSLANEFLPRIEAEARLLHDLQATHTAPAQASSPG